MTKQELALFDESTLQTLGIFGMRDQLLQKRKEVVRREAVKTLRKVIEDLESGKNLKGYSWFESPAGDGYGLDNSLLELCPPLVECTLEMFRE